MGGLLNNSWYCVSSQMRQLCDFDRSTAVRGSLIYTQRCKLQLSQIVQASLALASIASSATFLQAQHSKFCNDRIPSFASIAFHALDA